MTDQEFRLLAHEYLMKAQDDTDHESRLLKHARKSIQCISTLGVDTSQMVHVLTILVDHQEIAELRHARAIAGTKALELLLEHLPSI